MTVRTADGVLHLEGRCSAEDAETLLVALQSQPRTIVDISAVTRLHMAVAQILIGVAPLLQGECADPCLAMILRRNG